MPVYKLTYFNARGWAEPTRWIFALTETPYEDNRIDLPADWATSELKKSLPWGQLPVLEVDGKILAQSMTIARYLARKFNLTGKGEMESATCDEIVDAVMDFAQNWRAVSAYSSLDEETKQKKVDEIMENITPRYFGKFNTILEENGGTWMVNKDGVTWADILVTYIILQFNQIFNVELAKGYDVLNALVERVITTPQIKNWIENRPQTEY